MGHKVQVSFTDDQWRLIARLKSSMGTSDADAVRNIVVAWLSEKSLISTSVKNGMVHEGDRR
jgi:hypothetical protein